MTNTDEPIRELKAFRDYVDGLPGQRGKPIWLTEFGVVWGYPTLCAEGEKFSSCGAPLAVEEMARFLDTLFGWLRTDGRTLGIERWFLFTNFPPPEPFAAEPGGIALLDGSSAEAGLTRFGRVFAGQARQVG
jgi:hypothetical protein